MDLKKEIIILNKKGKDTNKRVKESYVSNIHQMTS